MTANSFIREIAIKIFSEAEKIKNELYYKVLKIDNNFTVQELQEDYMLAWFLGEFCDTILERYIVERIKEYDCGFKIVYLIEDKHVLETVVFGYDCYDNLDWKFVEKKTKMVGITEWIEI